MAGLPNALVGLAILVLVWQPLWWLAGGRKPLGWRSLLAAAAAYGVLAVDQTSEGPVLAFVALLNCMGLTWTAASRHRAEVAANTPEEATIGH
jgi:hypothetical protein